MASHPEDILLTAEEIGRTVERLAREIQARHPETAGLCLLGIRRGGETLARRLVEGLTSLSGGKAPKLGFLDITLYRDDWTRVGKRPVVGRTEMGFPVKDKVVVLVDDVLYTGRTVRAALDEITDFGRPRRIELVVLVDRGCRELPIRPDYVGALFQGGRDEVIDVQISALGDSEDKVLKKPRR